MVIIDNKEDLQKLRSKLHSDNVNCVYFIGHQFSSKEK